MQTSHWFFESFTICPESYTVVKLQMSNTNPPLILLILHPCIPSLVLESNCKCLTQIFQMIILRALGHSLKAVRVLYYSIEGSDPSSKSVWQVVGGIRWFSFALYEVALVHVSWYTRLNLLLMALMALMTLIALVSFSVMFVFSLPFPSHVGNQFFANANLLDHVYHQKLILRKQFCCETANIQYKSVIDSSHFFTLVFHK